MLDQLGDQPLLAFGWIEMFSRIGRRLAQWRETLHGRTEAVEELRQPLFKTGADRHALVAIDEFEAVRERAKQSVSTGHFMLHRVEVGGPPFAGSGSGPAFARAAGGSTCRGIGVTS